MSGYRKALRYSEEACQLEPENGDFLSTLGVAYYRVGNYEKALDVLSRSDKINALKDKGSRPADLAFLAMAHQQLGHAKEAEAKLQLLRERMKDPRWAQTPRLRASCAKRKNCWQNPSRPAASKPVRAARGRVRSLPSGIRWGPSGASKDLERACVVRAARGQASREFKFRGDFRRFRIVTEHAAELHETVESFAHGRVAAFSRWDAACRLP